MPDRYDGAIARDDCVGVETPPEPAHWGHALLLDKSAARRLVKIDDHATAVIVLYVICRTGIDLKVALPRDCNPPAGLPATQ